ncbi:MAG: hypothetical protein U0807_05135 [Candidatus Binatia bacterium]
MRGALLVLAVLATLAGAGEQPPVTIRAWTQPEKITIGTRFRYTIEVTAAPDVEVLLTQPTERIGDFEIVDFGDLPPRAQDGATVVTRWFTLVGWEPGHHLVRSPPVKLRRAGEDLADAPADEMGVTVESVLEAAPDTTDIHDIRGPEAVPVDWRPYWVLGGALAALGALALGVRVLARRRRRGAPVAVPPRPPHEVAIEALAALHRRNLVERGEVKAYYSALSAIVRRYLEGRYGLRAPEMTSEEFLLSAARDGRVAGPHRALLGAFLQESDLVKFARHVPTLADAERAMAAARRVVEETIPREEAPRAAG